MQPIGTITMYYPFLDEETRRIMEEIMEKANNYYDFVGKLKEFVLAEEPTDLLIYFAIHHSGLLLDIDSYQEIGRKYSKVPIIQPSLFYVSVLQGNYEHVAYAHEAVDDFLSTNPPVWLALEMRCLRFEVDLLQYPKTLYNTKNVDEIERIMKHNPQMEFFYNILYDCYRERAMRNGDIEEAIQYTKLAIEYAERFNDTVRLAYHLRTIADYLQRTNLTEARQCLLEAHELMLSLEIPVGIASTLHHLSRLDAIRGEYSLSIERNLEAISIRDEVGLSIGVYALMLSTIYNTIGDPESGLDWARAAELDFETHPGVKPRSIMNQAWSHALLNRRNEALVLLESVKENVLKSGMESILAWFYFVNGVLDMMNDEYDSARSYMEEAVDLYEGKSYYENALIFVHHLALLDVISEHDSFPWLVFLENKARDEDLPGILGQVLVLKARQLHAYGDIEALNEVINEVKSIGREPGMRFLIDEVDRITRES